MKIVNNLVCLIAIVGMIAMTTEAFGQKCRHCGHRGGHFGAVAGGHQCGHHPGRCGSAAGCEGLCGGSDASVAGTCAPTGPCNARPGCSCPTACNGVGPEGYCIGCDHGGLHAPDHFSPCPVYAYSHHGRQATRMHRWNWDRSAQTSWHGNYNYWRWGQPTALVVPPTAGFQSEYNWGVAQTKSWPINHQFSRNFAGSGNVVEEGEGGTSFSSTPYWPSSTRQFGIYPVRGPW